MSPVHTTQPHFLFSSLFFFLSLPLNGKTSFLSFQIPSVTIYSRLHHLGSVQAHSQLDASTYSPADSTQICPASRAQAQRDCVSKHLIGATGPFQHQERSGGVGGEGGAGVSDGLSILKCHNTLYQNRNNIRVCLQHYTGRLLCTTDPSSLILHCGTLAQKYCNFCTRQLSCFWTMGVIVFFVWIVAATWSTSVVIYGPLLSQ